MASRRPTLSLERQDVDLDVGGHRPIEISAGGGRTVGQHPVPSVGTGGYFGPAGSDVDAADDLKGVRGAAVDDAVDGVAVDREAAAYPP